MAQATDNETFFKVVKFAQALLEEEPQDEITPALIGEKIDLVLAMNPRWKTVVDKSLLVEELVRRFSLWVGEASALKGDEDHSDWLSAARKTDWRYWQRYQEWLELSLSSHAVESLDKATDQILSLLEDPLRQGNWDRRGLVVGCPSSDILRQMVA